MKVHLIATAYKKEQLPILELPAVAFAGRSNVGKSTLINKLLNRKNLARVSKNAGKTISINFYKINETLIFIDLPGYGYAKVSSTNKNEWSTLIECFLINYKKVITVMLLLDVRRGVTNLDLEMYNYIKYHNINFFPVLTKIDKVDKNTINKTIKYVSTILNYNNKIPTVSYKDPSSLTNLWNTIFTAK